MHFDASFEPFMMVVMWWSDGGGRWAVSNCGGMGCVEEVMVVTILFFFLYPLYMFPYFVLISLHYIYSPYILLMFPSCCCAAHLHLIPTSFFPHVFLIFTL